MKAGELGSGRDRVAIGDTHWGGDEASSVTYYLKHGLIDVV